GGAGIMAVHKGCAAPERQVTGVAARRPASEGCEVPRGWCMGADRAWWSDWSSKPAGVRMDLGRFDSYTLPPRSVLFCVAPLRHGCDEPASVALAVSTPVAASRGTTLAIEHVGSRGVSRAPVFAQS